eukprot:scaffold183212_cov33-Tisochrysis_lutea.AAC.4
MRKGHHMHYSSIRAYISRTSFARNRHPIAVVPMRQPAHALPGVAHKARGQSVPRLYRGPARSP